MPILCQLHYKSCTVCSELLINYLKYRQGNRNLCMFKFCINYFYENHTILYPFVHRSSSGTFYVTYSVPDVWNKLTNRNILMNVLH